MKKLLYDLVATQPSGSTQRHGGGKYGEMIFYRMVERGIPFSCIYDSGLWLNPEIKDVCRQRGIPLYDCHTKNICDIIKEYGIKRVYSPLPSMRLLGIKNGCDILGTLHGLRDLETPRDWYFLKYKNTFRETVRFLISKIFSRAWDKYRRWRYQKIFFNSGLRFVTVSEHSRMAIKTWFPYCKEDVRCFYSPNTSRGGGDRQLL